MLKNYLKIALRNLFKYKAFSAINIFGLAAGMAFSLVIFLYVHHQLTADGFHQKSDRIFLVLKERHTPQGVRELNDTWVPMLSEMKSSFPSIAGGVRIFDRESWILTGSRKFRENVTYADPSLFEVFSFGLLKGDPKTALSEKNQVILTPQTAEKYFGSEDPVGKTLQLGFDKEVKVTGVMNEVPGNSTIQIDMLASFTTAINPGDEQMNNNWRGSFLYTFLLLDPKAVAGELESKFPVMVKKIWNDEGPNSTEKLKLRLLPLEEFHNWEFKSDIYSYILLTIAFSIIFIASINFMNLATARSIYRASEIAVRKTFGAGKGQIVKQFLGESFTVCLVSLVLGVVLVEMLLPVFNELFEVNLELPLLNPLVLAGLLALGVIIGVLAGFYPAFFVSRFKPVETLKSREPGISTGLGFRNVLVVFQFVVSIFLIIAAGVVWKQIDFMKNHNMNFEKNNIVTIPVGMDDFADEEAAAERLKTWKYELGQDPSILAVASSMGVPGRLPGFNVFAEPEKWDQEAPLRVRLTVIDHRFLELFEIPITEGRNFSESFSTESEESVIVNEAFVRAAGWTQGVGKKLTSGGRERTIVGVTRDYNFESLQSEVEPIIHVFRAGGSPALEYVSVRIKPDAVEDALAFLGSRWNELDPNREFEYFFVDDTFDRLYKEEVRTVGLVGWFSFLAVIIASLGLLGLTSLTVARRTREIAIRKVVGATMTNIVLLISKKFVVLVVVAYIISTPLSYYLMSNWLENYPYRVDIDPGIYILAGFIALLIAWITISYQTFKAALTNPAQSLKYE